MSDRPTTVSLDTIAELINRAREDYLDGLERESATMVAAIAVIVSTDQAARTAVAEYLALATMTAQPPHMDRIAAEHVMRLAAGE